MRTRSLTNLIVESFTIPKRRNRRRSKQIVEPELRTIVETPVTTMADTRTMSKLIQAPTEGYGDAIVLPAILAENFELKVGLLTLVTSSQFHGLERDDPHSHIRWFNKITSTLKYKNVPHDAVKLMFFPFSLEGAARIWLEKEPPRSIHTWEDLVSKFMNYFFPPSKTTNLKNDITNFQQRFDETFSEAWDRFKDLLPADGNLLNRTPRDALTIIENKSKVCTSRNKPVVSKISATTSSSTPAYLPEIIALTDAVKAMLLQNKTPSPAPVKVKEEICVTRGGPHPYYECLASYGNTFNASVAIGTYNQGGPGYRPQGETNYRDRNQMRPPGFPQPNMQNNQNRPLGSGSLPSNTVANLRGDLKVITTRSGVSYDGPTIPPTSSPLLKEVEHEPEATKDKVQTTNLGSTTHVQPQVVQVLIPQPDVAPKPNPKPLIPYPSRLNYQKLREKANNQMLKFLQIFQRLHFYISFADALLHMPKFASTFKNLLSNKDKLFEFANTPLNENCSAVLLKKLLEKLGDPGKFLILCDFPELDECLALANLGASINLMPLSVWKKFSLPELTPTSMTLKLANRSVSYPVGVAEDVFVKVGKFHFPADFVVVDYDVDPRVPLILERPFLRTAQALIDVHDEELTLRVNDEAITFNVGHTSRYSYRYDDESVNQIDVIDVTLEEYAQEEIDDVDFDSEGDILLLEKLLNDDPSSLLPLKELNFEELKIIKYSIDDPPELELKDLPSHLEYAFLEDTYKLPVIIAKNLQDDEKARLTSDDFKLAVQHQRRLNPKIHEVIKKEVIKLLDVGLIYPISDSPWVSPVYCVPKKGGMTVVTNEDNELIPTRIVSGWRVCIDYRKLNDATLKDHFPLPFMEQMLERLSGNKYYCFLDGFSGYFQIPIDPQDQEKTTFTCPYGRFAYRRMPFGLCNAPGTFQRCMMVILHDMIEETMEVFMDDFSVFGDSFSSCLSHLNKMLKRCKDTNLVLNWEKCHFMVKEGIILSHKISKNGIKVDKAKVDVIAKLPHPTSVKELTKAPILVATDWDLPFEIMCDASDFAVGVVLGQLYTDNSALKYLPAKQDAKPRLLPWILLLQEFDVIIRDKKGAENLAADHLSRLENPHQGDLEKKEINETFPLETLRMISFHSDSSYPWFANIANYHAGNFVVKEMSS
ncbi:reverse transcriptase domain-containing protein [Tanacetum coccineum]